MNKIVAPHIIKIKKKVWRDISRVRCYPNNNSTLFFCEVHHTTSEGSTLDGFETNTIYFENVSKGHLGAYYNREIEINEFGTIDIISTFNFVNKDGFCELEETIDENDDIKTGVICSKERTFGEWVKG